MANQLVLVRHGDHCRGRYVGRTDQALSAKGRLQAAALAGPLARLKGARFLSGPLCRTRETAEIAMGADGRFAIDENLREIDFGRWEGMSFAEIAVAYPAAVDRWAALAEDFAFPGGESIGDFHKRIGAAVGRIAADSAGTVVVFTHGGVIRFLICRLLGLPDRHHLLFDVRPASISEIRIDGGKGVLTLLNNRNHLENC
jgi:alpha-ribazole phosphatase